MTTDEIHTGFSRPIFIAINIRATNQTLGDLGHNARIALEKMTHVITEAAIPFLPVIGHKTAHLIQASRIPGFSNQFCTRQDGIRINIPKNGWQRRWLTMFITGKHGCQIKAESIHMHVLNPVAQTMPNQATHHGIIGIQGVETAGIISVLTLIIA